ADVPSCFFFFSSRRRHTRFSRDWSSDVCSSDLDRSAPPHPGRACPRCPLAHNRGAPGRTPRSARAGVPGTAAGLAPQARTAPPPFRPGRDPRSEEHTSELQSRENLVCRLLLEKKNNTQKRNCEEEYNEYI